MIWWLSLQKNFVQSRPFFPFLHRKNMKSHILLKPCQVTKVLVLLNFSGGVGIFSVSDWYEFSGNFWYKFMNFYNELVLFYESSFSQKRREPLLSECESEIWLVILSICSLVITPFSYTPTRIYTLLAGGQNFCGFCSW